MMFKLTILIGWHGFPWDGVVYLYIQLSSHWVKVMSLHKMVDLVRGLGHNPYLLGGTLHRTIRVSNSAAAQGDTENLYSGSN